MMYLLWKLWLIMGFPKVNCKKSTNADYTFRLLHYQTSLVDRETNLQKHTIASLMTTFHTIITGPNYHAQIAWRLKYGERL
jgi:hypothetical protein